MTMQSTNAGVDPWQTIQAAGHTWRVHPLGIDEQFEVECILINTLGPSTGNAIASLVEGLAPAIVSVLQDATGTGADFDLAGILGRDEIPADMREHWIAALDMTRKACWQDGGDPLPVSAVVPCELAAWRRVLEALDGLQAEADGDAGEIDYEDATIVSAWGELIGALVVELHQSIGRSEVFDLATVLPLQGRAAPAWLALVSASLAKVLRETAGRGVTFDLAGILRLDTSDPRIQRAWEGLLDSLATTGANIVRGAIYALAGQLSVIDVKRLFHLAVLSQKTTLSDPGMDARYVTDYDVLSRIIGHDPRGKWDLLGKALMVTYGKPSPPEESEGGGDA